MRFSPVKIGISAIIAVLLLGMWKLSVYRYVSAPPTSKASQPAPIVTQDPIPLRIPIFIYHSVRPHIPGESKVKDAYDITPELLEKQLRYLQDNGYTVVTLDDVLRYFEQGNTAPVAKPVVLTFDDGCDNQYQYAFPLLKKYKVPGVFFIYPNPISRARHFLTWAQIQEMHAAGMRIGSHSFTHPYFHKATQEELKKELSLSKSILEKRLGVPVIHFATPFGYSDANIQTLVKEAGYKTSRIIYKDAQQTNLFELHGILVSDSFANFVHSLKGLAPPQVTKQ